MANTGPSYGMSAAVAKKISGKRDPGQEAEALGWIYAVLGEPIPNGSYDDILRDGQVLCRFVNKICPDSVKKINSMGGQFKMMENIVAFQEGVKKIGVKESDVFQTVDLWEKKNVSQVTQCLSALGSILQRLRPDLPPFGPRLSDENKREFTDEQLRAGENVVSLQYGYNKGATQAGQSFGNTRHM